LLGCLWYIEFQMDDYSFASKIKLDREEKKRQQYEVAPHAMDEFLWGRDLESQHENILCKENFSMQVLQWWINLQQQHIARGEDPGQT
jgi:hypothetical protein